MEAGTGAPRGPYSPIDDRSRCHPDRKKKRTRSGCQNCRRKRRKCDEAKPRCMRCKRSDEKCEWGMRLAFRPENAQTASSSCFQMRGNSSTAGSRRFTIMDVTPEVIRDYHQFDPSAALDDNASDHSLQLNGTDQNNRHISATATGPRVSNQRTPRDAPSSTCTTPENVRNERHEDYYNVPRAHARGALTSSTAAGDDIHAIESNSELVDQTENVASSLLSLHQGLPQRAALSTNDRATENVNIPLSQPLPTQLDHFISTPEGSFEDGIFLPGSTYLELHSTLRNRIIQEVRSNEQTRHASPDSAKWMHTGMRPSTAPPSSDLSDDPIPADLPKKEEYVLWKNWLDEIAPWLDKFDNQRHFQHSLPILARSHDHLRYAMLALSARQLERKNRNMPIERSLALYQQAIHLLLPQLHTRTTAVIASCVVLCVLEMLSCSPKAWKRHLDGCASLMEAVGINGFVGGVDQALFWCFARMDVCGGLITSVKTLIPVNHWASQTGLEADVRRFRSITAFDAYANEAVYLCAQVLDLLASYPTMTSSTSFGRGAVNSTFIERWLSLWSHIDNWRAERPPEMSAVMNMSSSQNSPFPTVLYSNPAAISGNQLYHTASILMLQHKPPSVRLDQKPRSIFWHARQICAISISNDHHGAWTNSIQPLWIAGQWLSHPSEHAAILSLLERIETESGWGTEWRAQDLKEFWGDMDE